MASLPAGVVTLVFTDIEGSSDLWETHHSAFAPVLDEHNRLMRAASAAWNGVEVKTEGDAFFLVFARASDAVRFAVDAQLALHQKHWDEVLAGVGQLRVRMGLHSGEPILAIHPHGEADYFGPVVNRAARVGSAGHGGQIVISGATLTLAAGEMPAEISFADMGRHRLKGVGDETLFQVNHPDLPDRFPPLRTLSGTRHNLPQPGTAFIGREKEIAKWSEMLASPDTRLLTLIGFGGQGKTRLALQIGETVLNQFADGVWWIELEEARTSEAMVARIAHELRIHLQPQPTVREQLINFHKERELLLILDNTEQIPDAGKVVTDLLAAGPRVKVLVTTRRALEIRQERLAQVPPLPISDASALFAARAAARNPEFALRPENRVAVEELCRRLEGVPLAIELAASRSGVLAPAEIIERLDERFRLLQTRAPDLPPRQRALRGAIDWSYDLLSEDDKALLRELSVFAGGFTLAAVERVCPDFDALEGLAELRRHSLLSTDEIGGKSRFSMQESVRAYAAEKLEDSAGLDILRRRHAEFYLKFVETASGKLRTVGEPAALESVLVERANARAALAWSQVANRPELAGRLALALYDPLYRLGFWEEARAILTEGLSLGSAVPPPQAAALRLRLASLSHDTGAVATARAGAESALEGAQAAGDVAGQAAALNLLGILATDEGDPEAARAHFEASLALRAPGDHNGAAIALHNLARLATRRQERPAARELYDRALEARRAGGDLRGEAETLGNLGVLEQDDGNIAAAKALYERSLNLRRALRDRLGIALMLYNLAEIAESEADIQRAVILYSHSGHLFRELGSSYAAYPAQTLAALKEKLGTEFEPLASVAEKSAWEDWVPN